MSWMDANEYLVMEQAVRDRADEVERFTTEQAFRSETDLEELAPTAPPTPARRPDCPATRLGPARCLIARPPQAA
jgi:hypothetical protein